MLSLIFRKATEGSLSESGRVSAEAPVFLTVSQTGDIVVDDNPQENQVIIEKDGETHVIITEVNKVQVNDRRWVLTKSKVEKLHSTLHEIDVFLENVISTFQESLEANITIENEVKYIDEIIECFNKLITKHETLNNIDTWLKKAYDTDEKDFLTFRKEVTAEITFEDYDRTGNLEDVQASLERKKRYLAEKSIMFLDMPIDERLDKKAIKELKSQMEKLAGQNKEVGKLKEKFYEDYPELKIWSGLNSVDALAKHFKKMLTDDKSNRTVNPGDYVKVGNFEVEISNVINLEKPHPWNRPFDPDITYKDVDEILETVKNSDFAKKSMLNYIKQHLGDNYSEAEKKEKETELITDIQKILPTIRDLIRFDSKILRFDKGTPSKPELVCRKGDFGNSAYFVVSGKVDVILDHEKPIPEERLGRQKVKKKNFFQAIAQLVTNKHHVNEYRSGTSKELTNKDRAVFIQDFDKILSEFNPQTAATLEAGNMFGEISAMGRTPRTATVITNVPAILLEMRWQGLRDLRDNLPIIKEITDANFKARGLDVHIRATTIFKDLTEEERKEVEQECEFKSYGDFKWNMTYKDLAKKGELNNLANEPLIAADGDYPDSVFLIRSGFARVSRKFNNGHLTVNYLGKGSVFGLDQLKYNYENPHQPKNHEQTLTAIGYVDAIEVPRSVIVKYIFEKDSNLKSAHDQNMAKVDEGLKIEPEFQKVLPLSVSEKNVDQSLVEFMVEGRYINGTKAMLINMDRCTRCDDCVVACSNAHNGNPRFMRHGHKIDNFMVANACMHCNDPVCMIGCPTGAISRNTGGGEVIINDPTCIGCSTCANSCPYNNIRMVQYTEADTNKLKTDNETGEPLLKATKCDLCIDQPSGPSCQNACPHDALKRVDLSEISKVKGWLSTY